MIPAVQILKLIFVQGTNLLEGQKQVYNLIDIKPGQTLLYNAW